MISLSFGSVAGEPYPAALYKDMREFHSALATALGNGKIVVASGSNSPPPGVADFVSGPPGVIRVGGAEATSHTSNVRTVAFPDVVANYTILAPAAYSSSTYEYAWGDSFAAPVVAGTVGEAIHMLREQGTPYDAAKLRRALNASAIQWAPSDYDPTKSPSNDTLQYLYSPPAPHILPGAQMGWGYVDGRLAPEIARRVTQGDYTPKADIATQQAMAAYQAAREAYWANGGP